MFTFPEQDAAEGMCGKLVYAMYGIRDALQNWEREYESAFLAFGFTQGISSPCLFRHAERDIRTVTGTTSRLSPTMLSSSG